jgi:hypothetical protein
MKSASSSETVMEVAEVQGSIPSETTEATSTKNKLAADLATVKEVLPTPSGTSTHLGPEPGPTTVEGAPSGRSTRIITVASPEMYGVEVDVTGSPKNVGPTGPTTDDGAMEVLTTPVGTSKIINSAADDKCSTVTAAAPSTAAGSYSGSILKSVTTDNASEEGVSKLANHVAKYTIYSDNLYEST